MSQYPSALLIGGSLKNNFLPSLPDHCTSYYLLLGRWFRNWGTQSGLRLHPLNDPPGLLLLSRSLNHTPLTLGPGWRYTPVIGTVVISPTQRVHRHHFSMLYRNNVATWCCMMGGCHTLRYFWPHLRIVELPLCHCWNSRLFLWCTSRSTATCLFSSLWFWWYFLLFFLSCTCKFTDLVLLILFIIPILLHFYYHHEP